MMNARFAIAAVAASVLAVPAVAQDFTASPNYGTVNLQAGFTPDPHRTSVRSGGPIAASSISSSCAGNISNAPDVRLNYSAGSFPLIIRALSSADTTLVVNGPDGSWYCDDDSAGNLDPQLTFGSPSSGQYDIWIGTYGGTQTEAATLKISELQ